MRQRKKTDDAVFVADIKRLAEEIGRIPRQEDYKNGGNFSVNTLLLRKPWNQWLMEIFGQTNESHRTKRNRATDLEILQDVKRVADELGKPPTQAEYKERGKYPLSTMLRKQKWNDWLTSATGSVNYDRSENGGTRKISDQDLITDIQRVANELGHAPARGEYEKIGHYSSDTIVSRKLWADFVKDACGDLPTLPYTSREKITDEELLAQLKSLKRELGRIPLKEDLGGQDRFSYSAYVRAFGTFGNALVAAGLIDPLQRYCVPRQELIDELKRIYNMLGHTPTEAEFFDNSCMRSDYPFYLEFGSWTKALLAAEIPVIKAHKVSAEDVKEALQKLYAENNNDDSCLEYWNVHKAKKTRKFPYSCNTIKAKFDPLLWEDIMHECGFPNYVTNDRYVNGNRRGDCNGLDGNEYLSGLEKTIGDILFEFKNTNKIKDYEYEKSICDDRAWSCDFKIFFLDGRVLWLEADGLGKSRYHPYSSGENEKIKFYVDNNINFAIISYHTADIREKLEEILK